MKASYLRDLMQLYKYGKELLMVAVVEGEPG